MMVVKTKKNQLTILVVDDHEDDRFLLEQLFESNGYQVLLASNGDIAYEIITHQVVNLVISDVLMPIMDGLQLCKKIKSNNQFKHIPVILYTSIYSNEEDMKQAFKVGANQYLIKPIKPQNLLEILKQTFDEVTSNKSVEKNDSLAPVLESSEQYLKLYSTQLVKRLENEVEKLADEVKKRKKIEQKLHLSNKHLLLYRQLSSLAIIEWDAEFHIVDWNDAAERIFGYSLDDVKNIQASEFFVLNHASDKQVWNTLFTQNDDRQNIHTNITKEGKSIVCEWHNTIIYDENNNISRITSVIMDVTAEQQAKQKLIDKEYEQREILNSIIDGVITIDDTGNILSFNNAAEVLFGYKDEEVIGKNIKMLMPESFAIEHDKYLQHYINTGEAHLIGTELTRELEGRRKNNEVFPLKLLIAELPKAAGHRQRFIGSCQDLTYVKQQEEQLRRSLKMEALGKLTGGIAHDYNNMLGIVSGYAELLEDALIGQPKLEKYARQIQHASQRGAKLTKKLLTFSREKNMDAQVSNINTILQSEQHMLEKILTARINLKFDLIDDLWPVWIDASDLEDAIINICINAMHAIDGNGIITIQTRNEYVSVNNIKMLNLNQEGDYAVLNIIDTGCGMSKATKGKIFDPFFSTKGDKGTGLGLSQVYGFLQRSNGSVNVYSEQGVGSQFALYFPRYYENSSMNKHKESKAVKVFSGNESVLVVDDEDALLNLASEILGMQGYTVYRANNAKQALKILEHESVDLLLTDVIMPEMDGYQLVSIVQKKHPHIKIQMTSGFTNNLHKNDDHNMLHQNLIRKPYNSNDLLKSVRMLLNN